MLTTTFAQTKIGYGVRAGMNLSEVAATLNNEITSQWRVGFVGGFFADFRFNDNIGLELDLLYSQQGVTKYRMRHDSGRDAAGFKLNTNYINIPLLVKFYLTDKFNLAVGPQGSFLVKTKVDGLDNAEEYDYTKSSPNKANIDFVLGAGYEITDRLSMDLRYSIGITQTYKKRDGLRLTNGHNSAIQITAAYKF